MSNMSYCRFQNTSQDLDDCLNAIEQMRDENINPKISLSREEYRAFKKMLDLCESFVEAANEVEEISCDTDED